MDRLGEGDDVPVQGERWAEVFGKAIGPCGARTRSGWTCRNAGVGVGGRCRFHGGNSTGPRTPQGKARSAQNSRKRQEGGGATAADAGLQEGVQAPAEAVAVPAVLPGAGQAAAPAAGHQAPRRPFLDQVLDRALSGTARWPALDRLLQAVGGERPPTRAEAVGLARLPAADRLIDILIARGVIAECERGRRLVLVRGRP